MTHIDVGYRSPYLEGEWEDVVQMTFSISPPENFFDGNRFPSLEVIICDGLSLRDLSFVRPSKTVKDFCCSGNHLTSLAPLKAYPNLERIKCVNNRLVDIIIDARLKHLVELDCSCNSLERITFLQKCPNISRVYASWNNIPSLEWMVAPRLQHLNLYNNQIETTLGFPSLPELESLDVGSNPLRSLVGLSECIQLSSIEIDATKVISLAGLEFCHQLREVSGIPCVRTEDGICSELDLSILSGTWRISKTRGLTGWKITRVD